MEIPRARGPGRSGPRRRTGCLTCRARKVRCDEAKPVCANCTRLRLQCVYKSVIVQGIAGRPSRKRSVSNNSSSPPTTTTTDHEPEGDEEEEVVDLGFLRTVLRPDERRDPLQDRPQDIQGRTESRVQQDALLSSSVSPDGGGAELGIELGLGPELGIPFDMLGFIGEITSDFEQKHIDLTSRGNGTITSSPIAGVDGGIFHDERQMTWGQVPGEMAGDTGGLSESDTPGSTGGAVWEEQQLLQHFRESDPPPTIFGPVDLEWRYLRDVILSQSGGCRALVRAVYCYADVHKAWVEGTGKMGSRYHRASSEIQSWLLGEVSEEALQRVFTSVLLLMLAELLSTEGWRPATSFLHSAYLLLERFQSRTRSWTGFAHLVVSWVSLLDVKALVAGRDGDPLIELGNLTESDGSKATAVDRPSDVDNLFSQPGFLIQSAIVSPAFDFFLQTQQVIRRIVCIDLHHRSRGTVSDEFEVLQIAHQIGTDLETLWNRRPHVLDVYTQPEALLDTLSPQLATTICRTFRQYVANFLTLFIYLHRVAFAIYPRTDRVYRAVDQIIQLATVESRQHQHLPVSFIWPLFIAGLEGSRDQRSWIVQEIQRMASLSTSPAATATSTPAVRHPNAAKALLLLEEMTRRQDASRTWADSRCVRRELFADFFVMI